MFMYFGDNRNARSPAEYLQKKESLFEHVFFRQLQQTYSVDRFVFLHQKHTPYGWVAHERISPFETEGDYLITNKRGTVLGVMTADCIPIIAIDKVHNVVAIAHGGWRGVMAGIVPAMLDHIQREYLNDLSNVEIICGPAARACCYQVDKAFIDNLPLNEQTPGLQKSADNWYFDLVTYLSYQLKNYDILSFDTDKAQCTVCDTRFCSYRRQKDAALRQMSLVALV